MEHSNHDRNSFTLPGCWFPSVKVLSLHQGLLLIPLKYLWIFWPFLEKRILDPLPIFSRWGLNFEFLIQSHHLGGVKTMFWPKVEIEVESSFLLFKPPSILPNLSRRTYGYLYSLSYCWILFSSYGTGRTCSFCIFFHIYF